MPSLKPDFWGPYFWKTIHLIIIGLPDVLDSDIKHALTDFFFSLSSLLPCGACRIHYLDYIDKNPPNVTSKIDVWKWSVDLHNSVNQRTDKRLYTHDEAVQLTLQSDTQVIEKTSKHMFLQILIVLIIIDILIVIFYNSYLKR